jgi:hypothetical protein
VKVATHSQADRVGTGGFVIRKINDRNSMVGLVAARPDNLTHARSDGFARFEVGPEVDASHDPRFPGLVSDCVQRARLGWKLSRQN